MFCNIDEMREKDGCKNYLRMILLFPDISLYMKVLVEIIIFCSYFLHSIRNLSFRRNVYL